MGARELLNELTGAGLTITPDAGRLIVAPASRLTDVQRQRLREAKPELLALLAGGMPDSTHPEAVPSAATEEARFINRRDRLLRWGWARADAEDLAHRLTLRNRGDDHRVNCTDCGHCQLGRCNNYRQAGLNVSAIGRDWVALLQHCPGHKEIAE